MPRDPLIGIVGKPSSGKSTTFVVAGLVPGAHEGRGLGNKFLDDLRHADALIHVVDVSGTTDAEGKATRGYDPLNDIEWLQDEIFRWIEGNLKERWGSIKRRHTATKSSTVDTLQGQFSGYGSTADLVARAISKLELPPLEQWTDEQLSMVVRAFTKEKFPTVLALNKMDHPDADKNVSKILKKHADTKAVLTSAISEVFIRKLAKQGYVQYEEGTEFLDTKEDLPDSNLKDLDDKLRQRVEDVRDLVLYRFGSTGVVQVLQAAADVLELVPVYPVKNIHNFGGAQVFRDCVLLRRGTTVGQAARKIMGDIPLAAIEGAGGVKIAEDDIIDVKKNDILCFKPGARN
ncbi:hypothetical protein AWJ20_3410 [Sugiyamaella lignohabitans]|uniref:OBG-type G domain-containing protein n=1 Tax=Sugiyamaella lignohabitans TaxID=796027 RepID=A0A167FVX4_9ASCO|nr:uncharacterized protein AWJ20_3410 [Sugiyamaella lignohabitans]ANB15766.1 hypothetical protein AWJ20_3410 [Sugiyamaella lignohabitans]